MPCTSWRNVAGYVTFDAPKCQGTLSRTLTYPASFKAHQAKGRYPPGWAKTQIPDAIKSLDFE